MKNRTKMILTVMLIPLWLYLAWSATGRADEMFALSCALCALDILYARYDLIRVIQTKSGSYAIYDKQMNGYSIAAAIGSAAFMIMLRMELNMERIRITYIAALAFLLSAMFILAMRSRINKTN